MDHGGAVLVMWLELVRVQMLMLCQSMSSDSDSGSDRSWVPGPQRWHLVGEEYSDSELSIWSNSRREREQDRARVWDGNRFG